MFKLSKHFIQRKELLKQKSNKMTASLITDHDKYTERIKSLLLDNNKFITLTISNEAGINLYVNAKKNSFNILKLIIKIGKLALRVF